MKIISWNLNSRTNEETLKGQSSFLRLGEFDIITLQEVTLNSEIFFKESFKDMFVLSSFDLVEDKSILNFDSTSPNSHPELLKCLKTAYLKRYFDLSSPILPIHFQIDIFPSTNSHLYSSYHAFSPGAPKMLKNSVL